ncbi:unnamed protein product, partial [marine sediment metagenome]
MITLKVKDSGFMVELPGIAPFRSPAQVNITNIKLSHVITALKNLGVQDYEIISR